MLTEDQILQFWDDQQIFQQSIDQRPAGNSFVFYDGPPFATGLPHYGHIVASTIKDVVPRYWTLKGRRVERKWGWDCHGLPIENIVEKEMGSKSKKDIEALGVAAFNEQCRSKVLAYVKEWERIIRRLGRWADMKHSYKTMDLPFMESVWWVFKQLWDKGLITEGYRSMHICTRCETTLSQQEVSEGYKDIKDLSAVAKFELVDEPGTFVLAWTTTPWTLIGNVALAVGRNITYVTVSLSDNTKVVLAKERLEEIEGDYTIINEFVGENLLGKSYRPLFNYYATDPSLTHRDRGWKIYHGDFVSTAEGTGVVHIAPAFGQDDMDLGVQEQLPFVQHVNMDGTIKPEAKEFSGMNVKAKDDHQQTDIEIIKYLAHVGLLFSKKKYEHSYPHCWRCDTPLINYATSSWFVSVTSIKNRALELAEQIHWSPAHIKEGRFGKWLEGARDWSISRQRFWASVMPIWKCACGATRVFGSVAELEHESGNTITDLHKHIVDLITVPCAACGATMRRVPDVLDTWFDSGSMPYAQMHYPFENKETFEQNFPAEFIGEGVDQTRAWFYYLHVIATALNDKPAFKNVIVNGIVLAEDGKKMSKRLQNYPDPEKIIDRYGADALRMYLCLSPVMEAESLNFSEKGVDEMYKKMSLLITNMVQFWSLFRATSPAPAPTAPPASDDILDQWMVYRTIALVTQVETAMDGYRIPEAARALVDFVDECSTWYIRRSRSRFKGTDGSAGVATLGWTLRTFAITLAPFMPMLAESIYHELGAKPKASVHLEDWPSYRKASEGKPSITEEMEWVRRLASIVHQLRAEASIKVRQPLQRITIRPSLSPELQEILRDEVNVKEIVVDSTQKDEVLLDTTITAELKNEGTLRELVRCINAARKQAGLTINDRVNLHLQTPSTTLKSVIERNREHLATSTLTNIIDIVDGPTGATALSLNDTTIDIVLKKIE